MSNDWQDAVSGPYLARAVWQTRFPERSVYDFLNHGLYENPELIGMDYESAIDATPHLYGVSFGNGNNGVSHAWPNFYVRTCEPFILAAAAILSKFEAGEGIEWASVNTEIDGEAEYGISATIYNPPDDGDDYESSLESARDAITAAQTELDELESALPDEIDAEIDHAEQSAIDQARLTLEQAESELETLEQEEPGSWCDANGAWMTCEVFRVDDADTRAPVYTSLKDCFDASLISLAREV